MRALSETQPSDTPASSVFGQIKAGLEDALVIAKRDTTKPRPSVAERALQRRKHREKTRSAVRRGNYAVLSSIELESSWQMFQSLPGMELFSVQAASDNGCKAFLPLQPRVRHYRHTSRDDTRALIPRHFFVQTSEKLNLKRFRSYLNFHRIARPARSPAGNLVKVTGSDLLQLIELNTGLNAQWELPCFEKHEEPDEPLFSSGDRVKITEGPFMGFHGECLSCTLETAEIAVEIFGRESAIVFKVDSLSKIT